MDAEDTEIRLFLRSAQAQIHCPGCQQSSHRVHSRYERTLSDLAWATYRLKLQLQVRKFFCLNRECERRIFTERIPEIALPWARRTQRLAEQLTQIALALGGAAGARLSQRLRCGVSRNTLLRLIAKLPLPLIVVPKTLGVDDFAFRKRHRYGTILMDLDQRRPIALLNTRDAGALAEWLQQHPGVQVLSRDRSKEYKQGMKTGAPNAVQVADRFHLLQNLADVLEQVFGSHRSDLKAVEALHRTATVQANGRSVVPIALPRSTQSAQSQSEPRRNRRFAQYEQVWTLHRQGWSAPAIAHEVGISTRTVQRYLNCSTFPERQGRSDRGRSVLNPYKDYLLNRWNDGEHEIKPLFREIQQQGYGGSYMTVTRYIQQICQAQGRTVRRHPTTILPRVADPKQPPLTARRAVWVVLRRREQRDEQDDQLVARLIEQCPDFAAAIQLTQTFTQFVRDRQPDQLDPWLQAARSSSLPTFQRFAQGLQEDYAAAVRAGVTLAVSNGQVEGQINRLKMLKRQMYGRAGIELLRRRFQLAS